MPKDTNQRPITTNACNDVWLTVLIYYFGEQDQQGSGAKARGEFTAA